LKLLSASMRSTSSWSLAAAAWAAVLRADWGRKYLLYPCS
jgi:hypothetical protein